MSETMKLNMKMGFSGESKIVEVSPFECGNDILSKAGKGNSVLKGDLVYGRQRIDNTLPLYFYNLVSGDTFWYFEERASSFVEFNHLSGKVIIKDDDMYRTYFSIFKDKIYEKTRISANQQIFKIKYGDQEIELEGKDDKSNLRLKGINQNDNPQFTLSTLAGVPIVNLTITLPNNSSISLLVAVDQVDLAWLKKRIAEESGINEDVQVLKTLTDKSLDQYPNQLSSILSSESTIVVHLIEKIEVHVLTPTKIISSFVFSPSDTIKIVKEALLRSDERYLVENQILICNGIVRDNDLPLSHIRESIPLKIKLYIKLPIGVRMINGEKHSVEAYSSCKIATIKRVLDFPNKAPLHEITLYFRGELLPDDQILASTPIGKDDIIDLVPSTIHLKENIESIIIGDSPYVDADQAVDYFMDPALEVKIKENTYLRLSSIEVKQDNQLLEGNHVINVEKRSMQYDPAASLSMNTKYDVVVTAEFVESGVPITYAFSFLAQDPYHLEEYPVIRSRIWAILWKVNSVKIAEHKECQDEWNRLSNLMKKALDLRETVNRDKYLAERGNLPYNENDFQKMRSFCNSHIGEVLSLLTIIGELYCDAVEVHNDSVAGDKRVLAEKRLKSAKESLSHFAVTSDYSIILKEKLDTTHDDFQKSMERGIITAKVKTKVVGTDEETDIMVKYHSRLDIIKREYGILNHLNMRIGHAFVNSLALVNSDEILNYGNTRFIPGPLFHAFTMPCGAMNIKEKITNKYPEHDIVRDALQMTRVVADLHSLGLIWMDIKPENFVVFFNRNTGSTEVKGVDVEGVVHENTPITSGCTVIHTARYAAPELMKALKGKIQQIHATKELDIWSLGCTIIEMFASASRGSLWSKLNKVTDNEIELCLTNSLKQEDIDIALATLFQTFNHSESIIRCLGEMLSIDPRRRPAANDIATRRMLGGASSTNTVLQKISQDTSEIKVYVQHNGEVDHSH